MVLSIIKEELSHYKMLLSNANYGELYKWEALKTFQETWDIEADDFKLMYDKSLQSKISNNLWANPHWFPKTVMLHFID